MAVFVGFAGSVFAGLVVVVGCVVEPLVAGFVPAAFEFPEVGVLAGVEAGSVVIGVGSGGSGFDKMPEII